MNKQICKSASRDTAKLYKWPSREPDVKHAKALIKQSNKSKESECYVMYKGYDSEKIHALIREKIKIPSTVIPKYTHKTLSIDLSVD